jgi:hypothetical protein
MFEATKVYMFNIMHLSILSAIDKAAFESDLELLISLRQQGHDWSTKTMNYAAVKGELDCLKYLHENGCEWDARATSNAAAKGELDCLKYLHENGCEWNETAIDLAAWNGHLDCLKYLHENKCPYKLKDTFSGLSKHINKLDFDKNSWLREFLFPHVTSKNMPKELKNVCIAKIAQIALEKQAIEAELVDKVSFDVIKHCLLLFI